MADGAGELRVQNVWVMRHGDRIDDQEPLWVAHAKRPWDPPLAEGGLIRAWTAGKRLRGAGVPIHRVVVSPFLRCLQTAVEVIRALCCVVDDDSRLFAMETSQDAVLDPSRVKVSIEYGLSEMLNSEAIGSTVAPKDKKWFPHISDLGALLPSGTLDQSAESIYKELPQWEESVLEARKRYVSVIRALADKYPNENLLLVSHGEAIGASITSVLEDSMVFDVEYCANCHLQRKILSNPSQSFNTEDFKVVTESGQTASSWSMLRSSSSSDGFPFSFCYVNSVSKSSARRFPPSKAFIRASKFEANQERYLGGDRGNAGGRGCSAESRGRRDLFLISLASSSSLVALSAASGKVKGSNPYNERRLLEQNRKIQEANNAPEDFPNFIREGFQVKVVTSDDYVRCDSGLIYLDILVGKGDCPKDGQQAVVLIALICRTDLPRFGFEEGIRDMRPGGKRRLIIPPELGPPVGPSTFFSAKQFEVFDVELLDVKDCQRRTIGFYSDVPPGRGDQLEVVEMDQSDAKSRPSARK
ncbi:Peptidyl-prolyl cis-trans isomerase [Musa troglodytarum]|uniref:Peptidyl-prolyl cis-trans isomerase n=1 Tax=Musa troglodytarum TaxID=320322 RepID=A0A9E7EZA7_9LILI|nr:Peptidyl-prolyl cis-trans isomerase [Musa troglodytarum]